MGIVFSCRRSKQRFEDDSEKKESEKIEEIQIDRNITENKIPIEVYIKVAKKISEDAMGRKK